MAVEKKDEQKALEVLRTFENSSNATIIAKVSQAYEKRVVLHSPWGTKRFLDLPTGELLPRIC
ncbi:MAG: hypothetical protein OIF32_01750 [Campylobacterales bacterium]|nr:hypothetical protein [Campylobacterales bacterium]